MIIQCPRSKFKGVTMIGGRSSVHSAETVGIVMCRATFMAIIVLVSLLASGMTSGARAETLVVPQSIGSSCAFAVLDNNGLLHVLRGGSE